MEIRLAIEPRAYRVAVATRLPFQLRRVLGMLARVRHAACPQHLRPNIRSSGAGL